MPTAKLRARMRPIHLRFGVGRYSTEGAVSELWRAAWHVGPGTAAVVLIGTLIGAAANPLRLVAVGAVVSSITDDPQSLNASLGLLATVALVSAVLPTLLTAPVKELGRRVDLHLCQRLIACVGAPADVSHLEEPSVKDKISAVRGIAAPGVTPGACIAGYTSLLSTKLGATGSILILCNFRWWLGIGVAACAMLIRRRILRTWFMASTKQTADVSGLRRSEYLRDLAIEPQGAKESRLFGLAHLLIERHRVAWSTALWPVWQERRSTSIRNLRANLAVLLLALLAAAPIAAALMSGELDAADAVVLGGALAAIVPLGGFAPEADFPIRYGCLALPPLLELEANLSKPRLASERTAHRTDVAPRPCFSEAPLEPTDITFDAVSFRYRGRDRPVFENLDLRLEAGTTTALVGANGVGKTTIIKILARLYEPTSGHVYIGGTDLADIDIAEWRSSLGVIFQDFARYELSIRDNIGLGSTDKLHDIDAIEYAAEQAGLADIVRRLPLGWDTPLSPRYNQGVALSGGQWQKVALARSLLAVQNGARVLVLDEPTASLDVRAEADFYDRFLDLTRGTTTILISHRFSSVRRSKRICVIEDGRIREDGGHDELLERQGTYARMFNRQAARFAND